MLYIHLQTTKLIGKDSVACCVNMYIVKNSLHSVQGQSNLGTQGVVIITLTAAFHKRKINRGLIASAQCKNTFWFKQDPT